MDSHVRELFRVYISRENAECIGHVTPRAEAPVDPPSSPAPAHFQANESGAPSPSSQAPGFATADSSHAALALTPIQASTIQAESPLTWRDRPAPPWPVRPADEMPPETAAGGGDDAQRTGGSARAAAPEGAESAPTVAETVAAPVPSPRREAPDATRVCSLCGVAVALGGTLAKQQELWRSHIYSWAHQRMLHVYVAAQNGERRTLFGEEANMSTSLPPSPSFLRLLEPTATSPVALRDAEEEDEVREADPLIIDGTEAVYQQPEKQQAAITRGEWAENDIPHQKSATRLETLKEVAISDSRLNNSHVSRDHSPKVDGALVKSKQSTPTKANTGLYGKLPMKGLPPTPPNRKEDNESYMMFSPESIQCSPSSQLNRFPHEELVQKRERKMECVLEKYILRKVRKQLLFCMRRWFNAMFVRVTNVMNANSNHMKRSKQQEKVLSSPLVPLGSTGKEEQVKEVDTATASPGITTQPVPVSTPVEKPQANLFMESCAKEYAHVRPNSLSSSSFEMEVAEIDVSWFVRQRQDTSIKKEYRKYIAEESAREKEQEGDKGAMQSGTNTGTRGSELSSVTEISVEQGPSLYSRVRSAMRAEVLPSSAFPKTSEVLQTLRSSSLLSTTTPVKRTAWRSASASSSRSRTTRGGFAESSASSARPFESEAPALAVTSLSSDVLSPDAAPLPGGVSLADKLSPSPRASPRSAAAESAVCAGETVWSSAEENVSSRPNRRRSPMLSRASRGESESIFAASGAPLADRAPGRRGVARFTGTPGEFYRFSAGAFHRVSDPKSDAFVGANGHRPPTYVVRRALTPGVSPRGPPTPTPTRARSPLGPGRVNPYCATCVARFNLVLVDECMRPVASGRSRPGGASDCADCSGVVTRHAPLQSAPNTANAAAGDEEKKEKEKEKEKEEEKKEAVAVAVERRDEKWLGRQEKKLRKRLKALLRHDLPSRRGGKEWEEYLAALSQALRMLEALRACRAAVRSEGDRNELER